VLDVGCETGCLAVLLAQHGYTVVAADPAAASLDVAKSKGSNAAVTWVHADAAGVPAAGADLAVMTGNVTQVFLTGGQGDPGSGHHLSARSRGGSCLARSR
jgi:SAM-dependent methyltransferase